MPPLESLVAFGLASIVLIVMPGPTVLFVVGRALILGRKGALLSVLGNSAGLLVVVIAVAAGLGALIEASTLLLTVLKFVGAAYLVFLGVQAIRHRKRVTVGSADASASVWKVLRQSFVVGVTNPKSIAFFVAVLPQFVAPEAGWVPLQLFVLGVLFLALALVFDSAWALAAGAARDWFARSPKRVEALGAAGGAAMIGLGGAMAAASTS